MELETIVEKKVIQLLQKAIAFKASDIHIIPSETTYEIQFRKFNKLIPIDVFPEEIGTRVITYLKFLASLDISEKRKPQSGAFTKEFEESMYSFRISTLPSIYNRESLVIRLLLQNSTIPLNQLSIFQQSTYMIQQLIERKQGLLIISGATGSGKTTTLYSLVHHCTNELMRHVISLEDPVERAQKSMLQIQVNERAGVTYASGLKAILRHTPDVIMIGEIRDKETAEIALEAALTGHLVLTTVHAKDSVSSLYRMHDLGLSIEDLKQALIGVVFQTLVEVRDRDERKAIFEILSYPYLVNAFKAMQAGVDYILPKELTIAHQLEMSGLMQLEH